jgi:hypothetical protein
MHKAERGKLGTESASHTWHKNTKIQIYRTHLLHKLKKKWENNFVDKENFNHIKEKDRCSA